MSRYLFVLVFIALAITSILGQPVADSSEKTVEPSAGEPSEAEPSKTPESAKGMAPFRVYPVISLGFRYKVR